LLLLVACQVPNEEGAARVFLLPTGTPLDLHRDLVIPSDQAGVFVQGTRIGDRHRYDAACRLEVRTVAPSPQTVRADRFAVERVERIWEIFSGRVSGLRYARFAPRFDEGSHLLTFTTYLYLRSDRQPDVFRLACSHLQDSARNPRHLTVDEIRTVLAPVATLY
jgi:hypothetical protein